MLSGWLRAGYSRSDPAGGWRNYLLSDVHAVQVLDAPFVGTRPGYAAHDHRMREVYCELTPTAADALADGPLVIREPMPPSVSRAASIGDRTGGRLTNDVSSSPLAVDAGRTRDNEINPPDGM
jgi:hypothetical protein